MSGVEGKRNIPGSGDSKMKDREMRTSMVSVIGHIEAV